MDDISYDLRPDITASDIAAGIVSVVKSNRRVILPGYSVGPKLVGVMGTSIYNDVIDPANASYQQFEPTSLKATGCSVGSVISGLMPYVNGAFRLRFCTAVGGSWISTQSAGYSNQAGPWLEWQIPRALANPVDMALISMGTNDLSVYTGAIITSGQLDTLFALIDQGTQQLLNAGIVPNYQLIPLAGNSNRMLSHYAFNNRMVKYAQSAGVLTHDLMSYTIGNTDAWIGACTTDNVHPNATGASGIWAHLWDQLKDHFPGQSRGIAVRSPDANGATPRGNYIFGNLGISSGDGGWYNLSGSAGTKAMADWNYSGYNSGSQLFRGQGIKLTGTLVNGQTAYVAGGIPVAIPYSDLRGKRCLFSGFYACPTNGLTSDAATASLIKCDLVYTVNGKSAVVSALQNNWSNLGTWSDPRRFEVEFYYPSTGTPDNPTFTFGVTSRNRLTTESFELDMGQVSIIPLE